MCLILPDFRFFLWVRNTEMTHFRSGKNSFRREEGISVDLDELLFFLINYYQCNTIWVSDPKEIYIVLLIIDYVV